ncbi:nucleotidyltransferase [Tetragenococcus solitarius]|uniref:tRNA(Met) cytidine acetate ligase n=1 Tax=Tetragenococcus solitarius TaxID=71453 RepID=A0ABN3Y438_9ENTE|nr:nucleotidyltransferase [Tetragenococcus solitarius]
MNTCGIIAEYNPFHNGHKYQLQKAKEKAQADVMIVVMSGNFLQRGEPAIIDKWTRANEALQQGADLVVELPVHWSLQSADYFAKGSVRLLHALHCQNLSFGTDNSTDFDYASFGRFMLAHQKEFDKAYKEYDDPTLSYAQKIDRLLSNRYPSFTFSKDQPNHILGLTYTKENASFKQPMRIHPIQRVKASHHSTELTKEIASATAIRQAVLSQKEIKKVVPVKTAEDLLFYQVSWENYWPLLKYKILTSSLSELKEIYQMVEGLEYRLKSKIKEAKHFDELVELVKSKRYTRTRIQRLLCYILLNLKDEAVKNAWQHNYLHILGFSEKGQQYLQQEKKTISWPIISKVGKAQESIMALTIQSDNVYQLANAKITEQNFGKTPIRV